VGAVTAEQVAQYLADQHWERETARSAVSTLRQFYAWAVAVGRADSNPTALLPPLGTVPPMPRPCPQAIWEDAMRAGDDRQRLILTLGVRLGLRRGEIARASRSDLQQDLLGWSLLVHGKGGKQRMVPVPDDVARRLSRLPEGWLLPGCNGHLTAGHVGVLARRLLPGKWTLHTLRHAFATTAWQVSGDLAVVQDLLGHASPVTTRRYVLTSDEARRRVVGQVGDHYQSRERVA
jgi:integrase